MNDELKFGLSDLEIGDDLDVSLDNDTYQDQANPAPPAAGNYRMKALSLEPKKNKEKKQILVDDKFPIFVIGVVDIVEGLVDANGNPTTRKVGVFQDIGTKPFDRFGTPASGLGDLTRSYGTPNWKGLDPQDPDSGISRLKEAFEQGSLFTAQFDWSVYDKEFVDNAFAQLNLQAGLKAKDRSEEDRKLVNAIYREARVTGMRNFPYQNGRFVHVLQRENVSFKHPVSGTIVTIEGDHRALEARGTLTKFYPNLDYEAGHVKLGPAKVKVPAGVAA